MYDAALVFGLQIGGFDSLLNPGQLVGAENKNVLNTAVFKLIEHCEPILVALVLAYYDRQNFFAAFFADAEDYICGLFSDDAVIAYIEYDGVDENNRIYRIQRPFLPCFNFGYQFVGDTCDQAFADFESVRFLRSARISAVCSCLLRTYR